METTRGHMKTPGCHMETVKGLMVATKGHREITRGHMETIEGHKESTRDHLDTAGGHKEACVCQGAGACPPRTPCCSATPAMCPHRPGPRRSLSVTFANVLIECAQCLTSVIDIIVIRYTKLEKCHNISFLSIYRSLEPC